MSAPDTFDVVILAFDTDRDVSPAVELQRVFGIDEGAAWRLIDNLPMTVQRGVPSVRAEYFRRALGLIGASVEVRDRDGHAVEAPAEPAAPTAESEPSNEATAATLDGRTVATGFDRGDAHDALRRTIASETGRRAVADVAAAQSQGAAGPAPDLRSPAAATLKEAVPAPVGSRPPPAAAQPPAAGAGGWQMPTALQSADTAPDGGGEPGAPAASASAAPPAAPAGWGEPARVDQVAPRAPVAHMRSDVWDPAPPPPGGSGPEPQPAADPQPAPATTAGDGGLVIERHRMDSPQPSPAGGAAQPTAESGGNGAAGAPSSALDLDPDVAPPRRAPASAPPPAVGAAPPGADGADGSTDGTLEDLPAPLVNPPPAERRKRPRPGPAPGARPAPRQPRDRRSFGEALFSALMLPFSGAGPRWLLLVLVWSLVVGGVGKLVVDVPFVGAFATFFLAASLLAMICDYFRACMWPAITGDDGVQQGPELDAVHMAEAYMKLGMHPLLFLTASQAGAIWWIVTRTMEGVPPSGIVNNPITWAILFLPSYYWPAAVAVTAVRNDFSAIWNVKAGIQGLFADSIKHLIIYAVGVGVLLVTGGLGAVLAAAVGATGPLVIAALGVPAALSHGIMGALTGHLIRTTPGSYD